MKVELAAGDKIGHLTVLRKGGRRSSGDILWSCRCDCGTYTEATTYQLTHGGKKSCGCLKKHTKRRKDLTGMRFGRLTVVEFVGKRTGTRISQYKCLCDCGNETIVDSSALIRGDTLSCGCRFRELCIGRRRPAPILIKTNTTDGLYVDEHFNTFLFPWDIIDDIKEHSWYTNSNGYIEGVKIGVYPQVRILLHKLVCPCEPGLVIDHINGILWDNRRENLRVCTNQQNCMNRHNTKGYYYRNGKWEAKIQINGEVKVLGRFATESEAKAARYAAEKLYFGEFAPCRESDYES